MKRKNNELPALSVSALDLFASALGVFIILTSVSLPFIFNTSQSNLRNVAEAELEAKLKAELVDVSNPEIVLSELISEIIALRRALDEQKKLAEAGAMNAQTEANVADGLADKIASLETSLKELEEKLKTAMNPTNSMAKIPPLDLVIAIDTTGSMESELRSLQKGIIYLSRILIKWSDSPAVGIVEIVDQCDYRKRRLMPITEVNNQTINRLQRFVYALGGINTRCNTDREEGIHLALRDSIAMNWRDSASKRMIVIIADHPPYRHALDEVRRSIRSFSSTKDSKVSIVLAPNPSTTTAGRAIMRELALVGRGDYIEDSGSLIGAIMLTL